MGCISQQRVPNVPGGGSQFFFEVPFEVVPEEANIIKEFSVSVGESVVIEKEARASSKPEVSAQETVESSSSKTDSKILALNLDDMTTWKFLLVDGT